MYYFLALKNEMGIQEQIEKALPHLKGEEFSFREVNGGPGGVFGVVVGPTSDVIYDPSRQVWKEGKDYFIGWEKEQGQPKPEELRRKVIFPGHWVKLGDGNEWLIPVARYCGGETGLERAITMDRDGKVRQEILEKYKEFYEYAAWYLSWIGLDGGDPETVKDKTEAEFYMMCCRILGVNYRVGANEVSALQLLTNRVEIEIIKALADWPSWVKMMEAIKEKKNSPAG